VSDSESTNRRLAISLGLRALAAHASTDICLIWGILAALLFSVNGIGTVWTGLFAGMLSSSLMLAVIRMKKS
jgi:hypothetical protein